MRSMFFMRSARSRQVHSLEKMLVRHHEHPFIDTQIRLESPEQPEVDVPDATRLLTFVSLARSRDCQIRPIHIRNIKREAGVARAEKPSNRQRVAKRGDRDVRVFGPIKVGSILAVHAPAATVAFEREDASVVVCAPPNDLQRQGMPVARHLPDMIQPEATVPNANHRRYGLHTRHADGQRQALEAFDISAAPKENHRTLTHQRTETLRAPMFSATRIMTAIPAATVNTAPRRPFAVATRSSSPASPPLSKFATRTRTARPIAAPTPLPVDAMAEATPCSLSETPVPAAMNIVVNTTPSPMLRAISPGTNAPYEPSGDMARPSTAAPAAPRISATTMVCLIPKRVVMRPPKA